MNAVKLVLFILGAIALLGGFGHRALFQLGFIHRTRTERQMKQYLVLDFTFIVAGVGCLIALNLLD